MEQDQAKNCSPRLPKASTAGAEEAANDTYLTVWNRIPPTRPKYLVAYSCRIARNLSLKRFYANTAEKRNSYYDVALDELEETIPALSTVESAYDAKELTMYLNRFLKKSEQRGSLPLHAQILVRGQDQ